MTNSPLTNKWIADRGYGTGMALAFQGDEQFLARSVAFAVNFLLSPKSQIKQETASFVVVNTSMEALVNALQEEGYLRKMLELRAKSANQLSLLEDEDFPEDFEEKVAAYMAASMAALTSEAAAEVEKTNPVAGIFFEDKADLASMEKIAREFGRKYATEQIATLEFEDFMRHVPKNGVHTYTVSDLPEGFFPNRPPKQVGV